MAKRFKRPKSIGGSFRGGEEVPQVEVEELQQALNVIGASFDGRLIPFKTPDNYPGLQIEKADGTVEELRLLACPTTRAIRCLTGP